MHILVVGSTGAGKTTYAQKLASDMSMVASSWSCHFVYKWHAESGWGNIKKRYEKLRP